MIETCYENTTQTTTFWVLAETFIHTIYILQHQQPGHRLKMKNLMSRCTNETTQTTMDTTLTTTFWILAKTLMHTIYNVNNQFIGLRQKLWFHCPQMKQLKQPFFRLTTRMFRQWILRQRQPIQPFSQYSINRIMYFLQQRQLQCFLFRIRSYNYVYLIIILTQEEEHDQRFLQLSVEFSIHFVHFIHSYMILLPVLTTLFVERFQKNFCQKILLLRFISTLNNFI